MYQCRATRFHMPEADRDPMKAVSHTPPNGESVTNVWERGNGRNGPDGPGDGRADAPADD